RFRARKQGEIRALRAFLGTCADFATVSLHCSKLPFFAGPRRNRGRKDRLPRLQSAPRSRKLTPSHQWLSLRSLASRALSAAVSLEARSALRARRSASSPLSPAPIA